MVNNTYICCSRSDLPLHSWKRVTCVGNSAFLEGDHDLEENITSIALFKLRMRSYRMSLEKTNLNDISYTYSA